MAAHRQAFMFLLILLLAPFTTHAAGLCLQVAMPSLEERLLKVELDQGSTRLLNAVMEADAGESLTSARSESKNTLTAVNLNRILKQFRGDVEKLNQSLPEEMRVKISLRDAVNPGKDNANETLYVAAFKYPALDESGQPILIEGKPLRLSGKIRVRKYKIVAQKVNPATGKYNIETSALTRDQSFLEIKYKVPVKGADGKYTVEDRVKTTTFKNRSLLGDDPIAAMTDFALYQKNPSAYQEKIATLLQAQFQRSPQINQKLVRAQARLIENIFKHAVRAGQSLNPERQLIGANTRETLLILVLPSKIPGEKPIQVQVTIDKDIVMLDPVTKKVLGYYDPSLRVFESKLPLQHADFPESSMQNYVGLPLVYQLISDVQLNQEDGFEADHGKLYHRTVIDQR